MPTIDRGSLQEAARSGQAAPVVRLTTVTQPVQTSENRTYEFIFSDDSVDRMGDTIDVKGWSLDNFNKNPVALFGHNSKDVENVVGRAKNVRVRGSQLVGEIEFAPAEVNPKAETVRQMVEAGFLKSVSVGFVPLDYEFSNDKSRPFGIDFKRQELLEISVVPVPANANALLQARAAGIEIERLGLGVERGANAEDIAKLVEAAVAKALGDHALKAVVVEIKAGRVLSADTMDKLNTACMKIMGGHDEIRAMMADYSADPAADDGAEEDDAAKAASSARTKRLRLVEVARASVA